MRFGVFRCATCGLVDADGQALSVDGSVRPSSFMPPPKVDAVKAMQASGSRWTSTPAILVGTLAVDVGVMFAVLVATRGEHYWGFLVELVLAAALLSGKDLARRIFVGGSIARLVTVWVVFALSRTPSAALVTTTAQSMWWLYVLSRADVRRHFVPAGPAVSPT